MAAVLLAAALATGACSSGGDSPSGTARRPVLRAELAAPAAATTVIPAVGPAQAAAGVAHALFDGAPVVVLAPGDDGEALAAAADAAERLGVPLLPSPSTTPPATPGDADEPPTTRGGTSPDRGSAGDQVPDGEPAGPAADEVARLDPQAIVAFGAPAQTWAEQLAGVRNGDIKVVAAGVGRGPGAGWAARLPVVRPAPRADEVLVLVPPGPAGVAAAATARAAGGRAVPVDGPDPRADAAARARLAEAPVPETVVAVGEGFPPAEQLRDRVEVAAAGKELPGGGQLMFPGRRLVALYGHPGAPVLGTLGEQGPDEAVARARRLAADYEPVVDEPVVPAFEIITTVASSSPGPDGDYSAESEVGDLRPWIDAAAAAGVYVVLDLQPGRTDFLTQAQRYEELLVEPHVGLALDPEWRLAPDQVHLKQIGSVTAAEVNRVADWLAGLTRAHRLPQKLLLLHQFRNQMITDRARVDTDHDELAVLVHADGFGTPAQKLETWNSLRTTPLPGAWWGWKNFIDEDQPTLSPAETMALDPKPWYVSYQ